MTLTYFRTHLYKELPVFDYRARAFRCPVKGENIEQARAPSSGCIVLPEGDLDRLSDDGLAALIAHELGHIEKGHKSSHGLAEPVLIQWEADEAAINRLYLAGYCAGETLRKAGKEIASAYGRGSHHPWQAYPADCKPKKHKDRAIEDSALVFYKSGLGYYEKKDYDRAIEAYSQAIQVAPDYVAAFNDRGNVYLNKKDYERAIQDYSEAIRLRPGYALAFFNRGLAYQNKTDLERAIRDYDEAIRLKPDYTFAFYNRGRAHYGKRDYDRALADFNQAIQLDPNYAAAFNTRGLVYNAKRKYELAVQDYDQAIRIDAKYGVAFNNRGNAYRSLRNYDRAIQDYDEAIRLNSNYALAFNNRATAHRGNRDYERSLADYEAVVRIDPKIAQHRSMGVTLFYLGRIEQSAEALERAVKAAPQDGYAVLWRYIALAKENKLDIAARELSENAAKLTKPRWPAAVIDYYLGVIDETKMYAAADDSDPKKRSEQFCEANFYAGELRLFKNARDQAIPLLRAAEKACPPTFYESHGASAELKRLGF